MARSDSHPWGGERDGRLVGVDPAAAGHLGLPPAVAQAEEPARPALMVDLAAASPNGEGTSDSTAPVTWLRTFPWLSDAVDPADRSWWDQPVTADPAERSLRLARLSELAAGSQRDRAIGDIFPTLPPGLDLRALPIPPRAANALERRLFTTAADLAPLALEEIANWPWIGARSVDALLQTLADAAVRPGDTGRPVARPATRPRAWTPSHGGEGTVEGAVTAAGADDGTDAPRWLEVFPWLVLVVEPEHRDRWNHPIDRNRDDYGAQVARLSELAMMSQARATIGQIFPTLPPGLDLRTLKIPARVAYALDRQGCATAADLMPLFLREITRWRGVGERTVDPFLRVLADAAVVTGEASLTARPGLPRPPAGDAGQLPDQLSSLLADLRRLALWHVATGTPGQLLLAEPAGAGVPDEIASTARRVLGLRAGDVLPGEEARADAAALLEAAIERLDARSVDILARRVFADEPAVLGEIGAAHEVSRAHLRQLETRAREMLLDHVAQTWPLAPLAATVRGLVRSVRPLEDLLTVVPALAAPVAAAGQPVWRVLERLDDAYEVRDGWCVAPSMAHARSRTRLELEDAADAYGVVRLGDVTPVDCDDPGRRAEATTAWLRHCGYEVHAGHVVTRAQSVGDYAAAVLSIEGRPLSSQEILDVFTVERAGGSLREVMSADDRFERVDRDRWALRDWGLEAYSGIRAAVREYLDAHGGSANLDDLVASVTGRFSVSANSVATYAMSPPFQCNRRIVTLADSAREARKAPERTRRLFRQPGAWAFRIRIGEPHLHGSGTPAPMGIATVTGLRAGQARQLPSPAGPLTVAWTGLQPSFGSLRRHLEAAGVTEGSEVFLVLRDDGSWALDRVGALTGEPVADALRLAGATLAADAGEARGALAAAISLPAASSVEDLVSACRERGDNDIADLLDSARGDLEADLSPVSAGARAEAERITGLR